MMEKNKFYMAIFGFSAILLLTFLEPYSQYQIIAFFMVCMILFLAFSIEETIKSINQSKNIIKVVKGYKNKR